MADKTVHVKCSDGVQIYKNCLKHKMDVNNYHQTSPQSSKQPVDRIKSIYPNVNEDETPLPRSWSSLEKCSSIGLTQNNLRVHYKGLCVSFIHIFNYFRKKFFFCSLLFILQSMFERFS